MSNISRVLSNLQQERNRMEQELRSLDDAIGALKGLVSRNGTSLMGRKGTRPRRTLSLAARGKIAAAQRARWARVRGMKARRVLSVDARRRIAAAQRARWAKVRLQQKKAA